MQAAAASPLDRAADELIAHLELNKIHGFALDEELALATRLVEHDGNTVSRALSGLLLARMHQLGAPSVIVLNEKAALVEIDGIARQRGAEWLLLVVGERTEGQLQLRAELRAIDQGFWRPPAPRERTPIYATARHTLSFETAELTLPTEPAEADPTPGQPRFTGSPIRVATFSDRAFWEANRRRFRKRGFALFPHGPIVAMKACDLTGDETDELVVINREQLAVYAFNGNRMFELGTFSFAVLPKAAEPARDPIAAVSCELGQIRFGSSQLEHGYQIRVKTSRRIKKRNRRAVQLDPTRSFEGAPVANLPGGRVLLARSDGGRNRWSSTVWILKHGVDKRARAIDTSLADITSLPRGPAGWRIFAVDSEYQLARLTDKLQLIRFDKRAGAGVTAFSLEEEIYLITTDVRSKTKNDTIRLLAPRARKKKVLSRVEIKGAVLSTAVGALRSAGQIDVVVAAQRDDRTDLFFVEVTR